MEPQQHTRTQTPPPMPQQPPPQTMQAPTGAPTGGNPLQTPIGAPGRTGVSDYLRQYEPGTIGDSYRQVVDLFNTRPFSWISGNAANLGNHIRDPALHSVLSTNPTGLTWSQRGALTNQLADRDRDGLMDPGNDTTTHRAASAMPHWLRRGLFNAWSAPSGPPRDWSEPPDQD